MSTTVWTDTWYLATGRTRTGVLYPGLASATLEPAVRYDIDRVLSVTLAVDHDPAGGQFHVGEVESGEFGSPLSAGALFILHHPAAPEVDHQ